MADCTSRRHYSKRNGLTDNIKNILLKTKRTEDEQKIINQLIARMNSSPSREDPISKQPLLRVGNPSQKGLSAGNMGV
jgi:hypothetical protein